MPDQLPTVAIIGAGSSGIAAAKALHQRGIPFDCFEIGDKIGGNWVFGNKNGVSSAYRLLYINTSRDRMQYPDYPMPASYPDFPHHTQIAAYFDDYVDHFGFRDRIRFETKVNRAARRDDGVWELELSTGETRPYDALLVANGHHWDPRWPEPAFPGDFDGEQLHAHHYVEPDGYKDKNVVVVGMGNSAMDIAVEVSMTARSTLLSARRGVHIIPKYLFGRPLDQYPNDPRVPWSIRRRMYEGMMRMTVGKMEDYGLPKPDHHIGHAHPTISGRILDRIAHGAVRPKPNIAELQGDRVKFDDGSVEPVDTIIYCTGYKVTFPFFDEDFISAPDNDLPLFRRVFHPDIDNVFFLALLQPLGATMPLAAAQGEWIARYLLGEYALPDSAAVRSDMERERARMFKRYVASKRHTMQVDFDDYLYDLERELAQGADRARARGFERPLPARAAAPEREEVAA